MTKYSFSLFVFPLIPPTVFINHKSRTFDGTGNMQILYGVELYPLTFVCFCTRWMLRTDLMIHDGRIRENGAICSEHLKKRKEKKKTNRKKENVGDLQGAWGHYSVAVATYCYKNGTCLLITAAALKHFFFSPRWGQIVGFIIREAIRKRSALACKSIPVRAEGNQYVDL